MKTIVVKVSDSKKTILVGHKANKYQIGYQFGWCANPDGLEKDAEIKDFNPTGRTEVYDKDENPVKHEDGSPVMRWTF